MDRIESLAREFIKNQSHIDVKDWDPYLSQAVDVGSKWVLNRPNQIIAKPNGHDRQIYANQVLQKDICRKEDPSDLGPLHLTCFSMDVKCHTSVKPCIIELLKVASVFPTMLCDFNCLQQHNICKNYIGVLPQLLVGENDQQREY